MSDHRGSRLIAIAGGSGSGKTWLADQLQALLGEKAGRLSLDAFYRDRSNLAPSQREKLNFDDPAAIDWPLFERVLQQCAAGRPCRLPSYNFRTHCRGDDSSPQIPRPVTIVDGLWLLHRPSARKFYHLSIFTACSEKERLRRRLRRDVAERGRTPASVKEQFRETVAPMHRRFVEPQASQADLVLTYPFKASDVGRLHAAVWDLLQPPGAELMPSWVRETFRAELSALLRPTPSNS